jgi:uncharacterized tellurite resistance protein B-like protein
MTRLSFAPVAPELAIDTLFVMGVIMKADGKIESGERKAFDAAARALGLGSFTMPAERPNALRLDRSYEDRALLFAAAAWMLYADGQVAQTETALAGDLASRLQIDPSEQTRLALLARDSFAPGADGQPRDWTVAFASLVQTVLNPA